MLLSPLGAKPALYRHPLGLTNFQPLVSRAPLGITRKPLQPLPPISPIVQASLQENSRFDKEFIPAYGFEGYFTPKNEDFGDFTHEAVTDADKQLILGEPPANLSSQESEANITGIENTTPEKIAQPKPLDEVEPQIQSQTPSNFSKAEVLPSEDSVSSTPPNISESVIQPVRELPFEISIPIQPQTSEDNSITSTPPLSPSLDSQAETLPAIQPSLEFNSISVDVTPNQPISNDEVVISEKQTSTHLETTNPPALIQDSYFAGEDDFDDTQSVTFDISVPETTQVQPLRERETQPTSSLVEFNNDEALTTHSPNLDAEPVQENIIAAPPEIVQTKLETQAPVASQEITQNTPTPESISESSNIKTLPEALLPVQDLAEGAELSQNVNYDSTLLPTEDGEREVDFNNQTPNIDIIQPRLAESSLNTFSQPSPTENNIQPNLVISDISPQQSIPETSQTTNLSSVPAQTPDFSSQTENLTPQPPSLQGKEEYISSPLPTGEGLGERFLTSSEKSAQTEVPEVVFLATETNIQPSLVSSDISPQQSLSEIPETTNLSQAPAQTEVPEVLPLATETNIQPSLLSSDISYQQSISEVPNTDTSNNLYRETIEAEAKSTLAPAKETFIEEQVINQPSNLPSTEPKAIDILTPNQNTIQTYTEEQDNILREPLGKRQPLANEYSFLKPQLSKELIDQNRNDYDNISQPLDEFYPDSQISPIDIPATSTANIARKHEEFPTSYSEAPLEHFQSWSNIENLLQQTNSLTAENTASHPPLDFSFDNTNTIQRDVADTNTENTLSDNSEPIDNIPDLWSDISQLLSQNSEIEAETENTSGAKTLPDAETSTTLTSPSTQTAPQPATIDKGSQNNVNFNVDKDFDQDLEQLAHIIYQLIRQRLEIDQERLGNHYISPFSWSSNLILASTKSNSTQDARASPNLYFEDAKVQSLTIQVYALLRQKLEIESERYGNYYTKLLC